MKKTALILALAGVLSCQSSEEVIELHQKVETDKKVRISKRSLGQESIYKDSANIIYPVEFEIKHVSSKVRDVRLYYRVDDIILGQIKHFMIYNGDTDSIIYAIEDLQYNEFPKSIVLRQRNFRKISAVEAETLLKQYKKKNMATIKDYEEVDLTSYKEFKKDHPEMIEKLRKIPDSIILSVAVKDSEPQLIRKKIEW
jgi:lipoprotein